MAPAGGSGVVVLASCLCPFTGGGIYAHDKMSSHPIRMTARLLPPHSNNSNPAAASSLSCRQPIVSAEPPPPAQSLVLLPHDNNNNNSSSRPQQQQQPHFSATTKQEAAGGAAMSAGLIDYFQVSKELVLRSKADGGPPRWFSLLDCASPSRTHHPLLLYLPGLDGVGSGLVLQCKKLGEIFDVWCLHIPLSDRSSFSDLVELAEETVRSENSRRPHTPVYLVGESFGGCLALAIASRNPDIDLVLVLANPATCFSKSQLYPLIPFSHLMPKEMNPSLLYVLSLVSGFPSRMAVDALQKSLPLGQTVGELSQAAGAVSSYISAAGILCYTTPTSFNNEGPRFWLIF